MQLYEKSTQKERKQPVAYEQNIILIMEAFELSGWDPAPKERDYIKEWSNMGFETDVLVEACNRTMDSINEANFMYANCILKEWKRRGVHNMEDVIELDQKYYSRKFPAQKK
ncbi:MAG: DnaD domain protein [Lachnospiraceae bacterium]|nr:DnaD domain protein [Lachnospiraceae bacterium]